MSQSGLMLYSYKMPPGTGASDSSSNKRVSTKNAAAMGYRSEEAYLSMKAVNKDADVG